eukprot:742188-Rhodomonas_salina.1
MLSSRVQGAVAQAVRRVAATPVLASRVSARFPTHARWMSGDAKAGAIPTKLTLNLMAPHEAVFVGKQVDQ